MELKTCNKCENMGQNTLQQSYCKKLRFKKQEVIVSVAGNIVYKQSGVINGSEGFLLAENCPDHEVKPENKKYLKSIKKSNKKVIIVGIKEDSLFWQPLMKESGFDVHFPLEKKPHKHSSHTLNVGSDDLIWAWAERHKYEVMV